MIPESEQAAIVTRYQERADLYRTLAESAQRLLEQGLATCPVRIHELCSRPKDLDSLRKKLTGVKSYRALEDITDLAGLRVTTYFSADVDEVAHVVERCFTIDWLNSIDKRTLMAPDRFGYMSLHYVAELTPALVEHPSYTRLKGLKFEIQLRSLCQHAWAEIEHDEGYKSAMGVPRDIRRRFARISSLLELADDEFDTIRRHQRQYSEQVTLTIGADPASVDINRTSLGALFSSSNSSVSRLASAIAGSCHTQLIESHKHALDWIASGIATLGLNSILDVEKAVNGSAVQIAAFAREWYRDDPSVSSAGRPIRRETVLLFLAYLRLAEDDDDAALVRFLDAARVLPEGDRGHLVDRIRKTYARLHPA